MRCFAAVAAKQTRSMLLSLFFYIDIAAVVPFYVECIVAPNPNPNPHPHPNPNPDPYPEL